jgi:hypothetical protein
MIRLVCTGSRGFPHRRVVVYAYEGAVPLPPAILPGAQLELRCKRCRRGPQVNDAQLHALLTIARDRDNILDISQGS